MARRYLFLLLLCLRFGCHFNAFQRHLWMNQTVSFAGDSLFAYGWQISNIVAQPHYPDEFVLDILIKSAWPTWRSSSYRRHAKQIGAFFIDNRWLIKHWFMGIRSARWATGWSIRLLNSSFIFGHDVLVYPVWLFTSGRINSCRLLCCCYFQWVAHL